MRAEKKPYYDTKRKRLADIVPLEYPFTVYIEQTRYCNFKCYYCIHSTRDDKDGEFNKLGYSIKHMDFEMYKEALNQLSEFPKGGIKRIVFSGLGEPLMNPKLPEMVKLAVESKICDRVEVITNGILLKPEVSDRLIEAGITNINISIQGINEQQYEKTCGFKVNYNELLNNLTYLYNNKKNTQIYIKIIDAILDGKEEEEKFYKMFGNICDKIYIEHLIVMQQSMNSQLGNNVDSSRNFYGEIVEEERKVCAQAFYFLQIGCDFETFPCPNPGMPISLSMGNMKDESLLEIWNGERRKKLLRTMLKKEKDKIEACKNCNNFTCINNPLEDLDKDAEKLLPLFE